MTSSRKTYTKKSFVDTSGHVKDKKIMEPLLFAKNNWKKKPIEKVFVKAHVFWLKRLLLKNSMSKKDLAGDLYLHKDFEKNKTIVILVHGFSDSSSGMAYLAESYFEKGISSLAVNLYAHGESAGNFSSLGDASADGRDILSWFNFLRNRFGSDTKIILHGVSMGGATVIQAAFTYGIPAILVVSDCASSDFSVQMKNSVRKFFPKGFISALLVNGIIFFASFTSFFVNGFFFCKNSPVKVLRDSKKADYSVPLLIMHGENDTLVPIIHAEKIYNSASEPRKFLRVKNAPHIGSWFYDKDRYMTEIFELL